MKNMVKVLEYWRLGVHGRFYLNTNTPTQQYVLFLLFICLFSACKAPETEASFPIAQIKTPKGEMLLWLYDETPIHKASFLKMARGGYWDTLSFNRVIEDFVIQGGCPDTPEGFADSPYLLEPEFRDSLKHVYGALGAGRDGNAEKLSAGCQFYIVDREEGIPRLDGDYTIFGQIIKGMEVLEAIATSPTDSLDQPLDEVGLEVNILMLTEAEIRKHGYQGKL
ncbi:MAG: peptidylprolyl isomerase [Bacteroidia bacterium]|nr:peptidylprolyl isomerase [Bacteroidia bacterium]